MAPNVMVKGSNRSIMRAYAFYIRLQCLVVRGARLKPSNKAANGREDSSKVSRETYAKGFTENGCLNYAWVKG